MKKRVPTSICILAVLLIVVVGAVVIQSRTRIGERRQHVIEEFAWTYQLLSQDKGTDRLHEFLKARLYYWGMLMEPGALAQYPKIDYGPVDEQLLGAMRAGPPHADDPNDHYRAMMKCAGVGGPNQPVQRTSHPR